MKQVLGASLVCLALFASFAQAQSTAQINGTVRDAAGLAVAGSEIKATQTATGLVRTATSGTDGFYTLANLPIGPYVVEVSKEGFSKYVQSGIVLQVDSNPTVDAALKVGSVSDQITVQADATMVETHATGVGQVVDSQRVVEMPLNGRNATELIFLAGMANVSTQGAISSVRNYPTIVIAVAGGIPNGVTYTLDGTNYNDSYNHLNLPLPFPDALQEFKVETGALAPQYGSHSAAAVNVVTKSGTNAFHGDAFDFLRNGDLNARDFFAPARDTLRRNQFGGTLGGPIKKDKLFFFVGYQGTEQRSAPGQQTAYVPTPAMLGGDFTAFASPACNNGKQITLPAAQGFTNNVLAPARINPAALKFAAGLPVSATSPCGKVQYGLLNNSDENLSLVKMDYQINQKQTFFGRAYVALLDIPTTFDGKNLLTANTEASHYRSASLTLGHTYILSPSVVNSFRIGANRVDAPKLADNYGSWQSYGVNAVNFGLNNPQLSVTGNGFAIGGGNDILGLANTGPNYNITDDVSWLKGTHQFGFGVNLEHELLNSKTGVNSAGTATFNGSVTGLGLADFITGSASGWKQGSLGQYWIRSYDNAFYAQDAWKISSRLLLSYGIRWEPYTPVYSKFGEFDHFIQANFNNNVHSSVYTNAPAGLIFPGDTQWTSGKSMANNRLNQFLPRVGLVFDPMGDGKMTIRASYGRFADRMNLLGFTAFGQNAPWANNISLANVNLSSPWATYPGGVNPLPIPLTSTITFPSFSSDASFPQDWRPTTVDSWNFSVQRQFGTDWLVTANFVGNHTIHLIAAGEQNQAAFLGLGACTIPGPNGTSNTYPVCSTTANTNQRRLLYLQNPNQGQYYSVVGTLDDGGTGSYSAGYLSVQKRLSKGASLLANYTLSHCISDLWNGFPGNGGASSVTPGNRQHERSNCNQSDQRQVFNLSAVLQSPKFSNTLLRWLASDWQLAPIMKIKSAQFFTVTTGVDNALSGEGAQRPNLVGGAAIYPGNQSVGGWVNPGAFVSPAAGTYGNLSANNLKGPGIFQLDMSLSRSFRIREKLTTQLRVESFNLLNHLNPAVPIAATNSAAFGQIQNDISGTSGLLAGDPRIVQVALKIIF